MSHHLECPHAGFFLKHVRQPKASNRSHVLFWEPVPCKQYICPRVWDVTPSEEMTLGFVFSPLGDRNPLPKYCLKNNITPLNLWKTWQARMFYFALITHTLEHLMWSVTTGNSFSTLIHPIALLILKLVAFLFIKI